MNVDMVLSAELARVRQREGAYMEALHLTTTKPDPMIAVHVGFAVGGGPVFQVFRREGETYHAVTDHGTNDPVAAEKALARAKEWMKP